MKFVGYFVRFLQNPPETRLEEPEKNFRNTLEHSYSTLVLNRAEMKTEATALSSTLRP